VQIDSHDATGTSERMNLMAGPQALNNIPKMVGMAN